MSVINLPFTSSGEENSQPWFGSNDLSGFGQIGKVIFFNCSFKSRSKKLCFTIKLKLKNAGNFFLNGGNLKLSVCYYVNYYSVFCSEL